MERAEATARGRHRPERLDRRRNSLNALRLILATLVIVSHVPKALGGEALAWGDLEVGGWAVAGFFAVSGWLVTESRLRLGLVEYLWHRALRIYPGFWACLAVTAFVFAPLAAAAGPGSWSPVAAIRYVVQNATLLVTEPLVGSSLEGAPVPGSWNLSLWTLAYEVLCYLGVGVLLLWQTARRRPAVVVAAFLLTSAMNAALVWGGAPRDSVLPLACRLASFFLAGAVLLRCRSIQLTGPVATLLAGLLVVLTLTEQVRALGAFPIAYVCLYLGRVLPLHRVGRRTDISYGVYVYAFPVQQLLAVAGIATGNRLLYFLATLALVVPLAWASWRFVEKPALRLKKAPPFLVPRLRPAGVAAPAPVLPPASAGVSAHSG